MSALMASVAVIVAAGLFAALAAIILTILIRHAVSERRNQRLRAHWSSYQESVLEFVAEGGGDAERRLAQAKPGSERSSIGALISEYARIIRGEPRTRIATFLQNHGYVDDEIQKLRDSRHSWRRIWAAQLLGDFGAPVAARDLAVAMIADPSAEVRLAATRAIGHIDDYKSAAALLTVLPTDLVPRGVVAQALLDLGGRAFAPLVDACRDAEVEVRYFACRLIGLIGSGASSAQGALAIQAVADVATTDSDEHVRAAACLALGAIGDMSVTASIQHSLKDDSWRVRGAAALASGELGLAECVPGLRQLLDDTSVEVQRAAAYAMVAIDPRCADTRPFISEARFSPIEGYSDVFV